MLLVCFISTRLTYGKIIKTDAFSQTVGESHLYHTVTFACWLSIRSGLEKNPINQGDTGKGLAAERAVIYSLGTDPG